jgi:hypothetical protein
MYVWTHTKDERRATGSIVCSATHRNRRGRPQEPDSKGKTAA